MKARHLKLSLSKTQESLLEQWLWHLSGVYNWAIRKIALDARDGAWHSEFDLQNSLANHSERLGIPSHTLQGTILQAHRAWQRCFNKTAGRPRLKGRRNKMNSIPFPDPIRPPKNGRIGVPGLGRIRFHKQTLPDGRIKCGRIIKRASGWHLCLWIDCDDILPVVATGTEIGVDPGFSTLLTLSDGTKIENPRELRRGAERLAQAQRSGSKRRVARLQERQANRRRDRNHKISRKLVENYATIYYSNDNFRGLAKTHGKSVTEAGLGQLIGYLNYKCRIGGRKLVPVNSRFTTMTCSACGARTGPSGWGGLAVRQWNCACGAQHDRDINAARNVLFAGAGCALKESSNGLN